MGNVLETQKIEMSDETKITKEFRVSLFMEGTEKVVNTNLKKYVYLQQDVYPVFSEEKNHPVICTDFDSSLAVQ